MVVVAAAAAAAVIDGLVEVNVVVVVVVAVLLPLVCRPDCCYRFCGAASRKGLFLSLVFLAAGDVIVLQVAALFIVCSVSLMFAMLALPGWYPAIGRRSCCGLVGVFECLREAAGMTMASLAVSKPSMR